MSSAYRARSEVPANGPPPARPSPPPLCARGLWRGFVLAESSAGRRLAPASSALVRSRMCQRENSQDRHEAADQAVGSPKRRGPPRPTHVLQIAQPSDRLRQARFATASSSRRVSCAEAVAGAAITNMNAAPNPNRPTTAILVRLEPDLRRLVFLRLFTDGFSAIIFSCKGRNAHVRARQNAAR